MKAIFDSTLGRGTSALVEIEDALISEEDGLGLLSSLPTFVSDGLGTAPTVVGVFDRLSNPSKDSPEPWRTAKGDDAAAEFPRVPPPNGRLDPLVKCACFACLPKGDDMDVGLPKTGCGRPSEGLEL